MSFALLLPWPVLAVVVVVTGLWAARRWRTTERSRLSVVRMVAIVALLVVIAVDPAIDGGRVAAIRSDADVLFVVDTTGSMGAEDYDGRHPRLDGVRADIVALAEQFPGAHFALVTFDTTERIVVPWTTDVGAFETAVSLLRQERTMYARGSQLDRPTAAMARLVPRSDDGSRYSVAFYLSDGEQTTGAEMPGEASSRWRALDPAISDGAVLGYGTVDGGRMRVYTDRDSTLDQYIQDPLTGQDAISRIDEGALRAIADDLGVRYVHRTGPGGLDGVAADIAGDATRERAGARDGDRRLYWVAAFGVVGLVLWQLAATAVELGDARRALVRPTRRPAGSAAR